MENLLLITFFSGVFMVLIPFLLFIRWTVRILNRYEDACLKMQKALRDHGVKVVE